MFGTIANTDPTLIFAWLAFGYFCGSVPFGLIFAKLGGVRDIRKTGSGNIGATNVLRSGNKGLAFATLAMDLLKGSFAFGFISHYSGHEAGLISGFGALIGHIFPFWLKFKGGKGVATYIGVLFAASFNMGLTFGLIWLSVAFATRFSSLAALVATAIIPVFLFFSHKPTALVFAIMSLIVWAMHSGNIKRLLNGSEARIGGDGSRRRRAKRAAARGDGQD